MGTGQHLQRRAQSCQCIGISLGAVDPLADDALDVLVDLGIGDDFLHGHALGKPEAAFCCIVLGSFLGSCGSGGLLRGFPHPGAVLSHLAHGGTRPFGDPVLGNTQFQKFLLPGGGSGNARFGGSVPAGCPAISGRRTLGKELEFPPFVLKHGASSCMI